MAPLLRLFHNLLQQQLSASVYSFLVNNHAFQAFAVQSSRKAAELKDQVARSVEEAVKATSCSGKALFFFLFFLVRWQEGGRAPERGGENSPGRRQDASCARRGLSLRSQKAVLVVTGNLNDRVSLLVTHRFRHLWASKESHT
uniref:Uncharacterized protein n=1 Tax=Neospora caninum (strain Liverpool) TaxID=572307 RepID=A0A0F7ULC5_NEOCL|nr:TPA: hypothetical protein BN1204_055115 [Neospora caninum Liverpool]